MMSKIITIVGPTATGKTKLSVSLAHYLDSVIINADSTAIYKEPLIATAKVTEEEKENVPHYMLDLVSLNDDYTLFDYHKEGRRLLNHNQRIDDNVKKAIEPKDFVITFGNKHKGKTLEEIYNKDKEYLFWAVNNMRIEPARTYIRKFMEEKNEQL